jgi:hypothetical protein
LLRVVSKDIRTEAAMSLARYFVFERGGDWIVMLDGQPVGRHSNRPAALQSAIVMADLMGAMKHDADVMVEDGGRLDLAWSYGADALPQATGEAA